MGRVVYIRVKAFPGEREMRAKAARDLWSPIFNAAEEEIDLRNRGKRIES